MSQSSAIIIELQYFPCISAFKLMAESKQLMIEASEQYCKMSFRNRCIITGSNGIIHLSVPLKNGRQQRTFIRDVQIDNSVKWQNQHWRSIESCYARAPFYEYYEMKFQGLFQKEYAFLFDFNQTILDTLLSIYKSTTHITLTEKYAKEYEGIGDFRNTFLPKNYTEYPNTISAYTQVFEDKTGPLPNLSIVDYLCCAGVKL